MEVRLNRLFSQTLAIASKTSPFLSSSLSVKKKLLKQTIFGFTRGTIGGAHGSRTYTAKNNKYIFKKSYSVT